MVAVAWGWVERLESRTFRRWQLAVEASGCVGFLLRPARARGEPSWAQVQLEVNALPAGASLRRWDVRVVRGPGGAAGLLLALLLMGCPAPQQTAPPDAGWPAGALVVSERGALEDLIARASSLQGTPLADLAASFEQVVADVLVDRSLRCCREHGLNTLVMVGGVAANRRLRSLMEQRGLQAGVAVQCAPLAFCTDNAAMVGAAALQRLLRGPQNSSFGLGVAARWPLEQACALQNDPPPF